MNGVLTVTNGVPVPHSFNNNSEKDGIRKISTLEHKGFSYHALRDLVQRHENCTFVVIMKRTEDILAKLLLQNNDDWEIEDVVCDDSVEEIRITLKYRHSTIKVDGNEFPILDFRHERSWRHLDMWQYKTVLEAKIPRYRNGDKVKSVPVPWALPNSRLSWLMEKKR